MPLLEAKKLNKYFGGLHAVNNVNFGVEAGVIKAVIGPNGAGKTTLFNLITGNIPPTSGTVFFEGRDITGAKPYRVAQRGILRTFQNLKLAGHMTVKENVMIGRQTKSKAGFISSMLNLPVAWKEEKEIREKSFQMLELLSIADLSEHEAATLPFGKQRAVEFARALAAEPKLLLLDEPASGLNIYETTELAKLILKIRDRGITILLVEHDMSLVMDISDEIVVLNFGEKMAEGRPEEIRKNKDVIKIYLGETDDQNQKS
ncbi:MAG: ABC transporter ATP-binding protein [Spirochaetota bacterium]